MQRGELRLINYRNEGDFLRDFERRLNYLSSFVLDDSLFALRRFGRTIYQFESSGIVIDIDRLIPIAPLKYAQLSWDPDKFKIEKLTSRSLFVGPYWLLNAKFEPEKSQSINLSGDMVETFVAMIIMGSSERIFCSFALPDTTDRQQKPALVRKSMIDIEVCPTIVERSKLTYLCRVGTEKRGSNT